MNKKDKKRESILKLAKIGIIALVDEATSYQEVRGKKDLRNILKSYNKKKNDNGKI